MSQSLAEVRQFIRDLDSQACPVARRRAELNAAKERERQAARAAQRQREGQQAAAARNSEDWSAWVDERVRTYLFNTYNEAVGNALGRERGLMRKEFQTEIDKLRGELNKLREELSIGMERVPIAKDWSPDEPVCYRGSLVTYDGETFQALQDTARLPTADSPHWIRLASKGRDAVSPRICGAFDAQAAYERLDIIEHDGGSYIADRDLAPGNIPGIDDGWMPLARRGGKGPPGTVGPRGRKGERGASGQAAPQIVNWTVDVAHFRAIPTLADGRAGAPLDLHPLFERFNEVMLSAIDEAMQNAARAKLLSPLF